MVLICIHLGVQLYVSLNLPYPHMGHRECVRIVVYIGSAADGVLGGVNQLRLKLELGGRVDYFTNHFLPKRLIFEPLAR